MKPNVCSAKLLSAMFNQSKSCPFEANLMSLERSRLKNQISPISMINIKGIEADAPK